MGPDKDYAYELGDRAYKEVMKLLEEKYYINEANLSKGLFRDSFQRHTGQLKEVLQEIMYDDACDGF